MKSRALRVALILVAATLLLLLAWIWVTLTWSYADGERAGYIQKFSTKGWLCKTWEGELMMPSAPNEHSSATCRAAASGIARARTVPPGTRTPTSCSVSRCSWMASARVCQSVIPPDPGLRLGPDSTGSGPSQPSTASPFAASAAAIEPRARFASSGT